MSPAARAWARASYARRYKGEKAVRGERAYEQPANAVGPRQPDGRRGRLEDRLDEAFCPEYVNEEEVSSDMERTNGVGGVAGVRHDGREAGRRGKYPGKMGRYEGEGDGPDGRKRKGEGDVATQGGGIKEAGENGEGASTIWVQAGTGTLSFTRPGFVFLLTLKRSDTAFI